MKKLTSSKYLEMGNVETKANNLEAKHMIVVQAMEQLQKRHDETMEQLQKRHEEVAARQTTIEAGTHSMALLSEELEKRFGKFMNVKQNHRDKQDSYLAKMEKKLWFDNQHELDSMGDRVTSTNETLGAKIGSQEVELEKIGEELEKVKHDVDGVVGGLEAIQIMQEVWEAQINAKIVDGQEQVNAKIVDGSRNLDTRINVYAQFVDARIVAIHDKSMEYMLGTHQTAFEEMKTDLTEFIHKQVAKHMACVAPIITSQLVAGGWVLKIEDVD
jgi:chromosome segregation ATPase